MKRTFPLVVLIIVFCVGVVYAEDRPVTPYGDFCPMCSKYGMCKGLLSPTDTKKSLNSYYKHYGYTVVIKKITGRFVMADVLKNGKVVDTIIFDRKTGRIRSIY